MQALSRLSWWLIRAQFTTRRAATLLSMLAVALGVALGYAIHLINDAALADFARAMKSVQGDPDAVIAARDSAGSVPLATLNAIARDPAVLVIAAVIETRVRIDNARTPVHLDRHRRLQRRRGHARPAAATQRAGGGAEPLQRRRLCLAGAARQTCPTRPGQRLGRAPAPAR
jgi:hypothetical protein